MNLVIGVATMRPYDRHVIAPGHIPTWRALASSVEEFIPYQAVYNTPEHNLGIVGSYDEIYKRTNEEVIVYLHDDVVCKESFWNERVLKEFEDEKVAIVGFGGATRHGTEDLYKRPYYLPNLRRDGYGSNVDDAEIHGERFTGSKDVAVLDGFAIAVRRSFLERIGGWMVVARGANFYCYDYAICALARRYGYRIRCVGIRCHHLGGQTSTKGVEKITGQEAYEKSHRWFYEEFRDVMPWRVEVNNGVAIR